MPPPFRAHQLSGLRVLLILIPRSARWTAHVFAGVADCTDNRLTLSEESLSIEAPRETLNGFFPNVLPRVIDRQALGRLTALLQHGVQACVPLFVDSVHAGGIVLEYPFFGVGEGARGEVLLSQGFNEEDVGSDDDDE